MNILNVQRIPNNPPPVIGVRWGARGEGGRGGEGGGEGGGWVLEKAPWLAGRPAGWLAGWLAGRPAGWGAGWLAGCPKAKKAPFGPLAPFSPKNDFWHQKCILERKNRKWAPKAQKMGKWSSKHQRNHCLEQHLRQGAKMTPKGAPKRKKSIFCAQNLFLRSKSLFTKNAKKRTKMCEKGENGLQNT